MWRLHSTSESRGRVLKWSIESNEGKLSVERFLDLLACKGEFREFFNSQLVAAPFTAFRWEMPPTTASSRQQTFECVVLNSPGLNRSPDRSAFAEHFAAEKTGEVVVFSNLGRDATLIVPCPGADDSTYVHLAAFVRAAPPRQIDSFWQLVGEQALSKLCDEPIWLNTAGAGVPWLHVRLDSRPKYYCYTPYKNPQS